MNIDMKSSMAWLAVLLIGAGLGFWYDVEKTNERNEKLARDVLEFVRNHKKLTAREICDLQCYLLSPEPDESFRKVGLTDNEYRVLRGEAFGYAP